MFLSPDSLIIFSRIIRYGWIFVIITVMSAWILRNLRIGLLGSKKQRLASNYHLHRYNGHLIMLFIAQQKYSFIEMLQISELPQYFTYVYVDILLPFITFFFHLWTLHLIFLVCLLFLPFLVEFGVTLRLSDWQDWFRKTVTLMVAFC